GPLPRRFRNPLSPAVGGAEAAGQAPRSRTPPSSLLGLFVGEAGTRVGSTAGPIVEVAQPVEPCGRAGVEIGLPEGRRDGRVRGILLGGPGLAPGLDLGAESFEVGLLDG